MERQKKHVSSSCVTFLIKAGLAGFMVRKAHTW